MKRVFMVLSLTLVLVFGAAGIAGAITDGELDDNSHPMVVLIVMDVAGEPAFRCSGTLLSPTWS